MKMQDITHMDKDDLLGLLGLEPKRSYGSRLAGKLGTFAIGVLVGAGVAYFLAPKAGGAQRHDPSTKIPRDGKGVGGNGGEVADSGEGATRRV